MVSDSRPAQIVALVESIRADIVAADCQPVTMALRATLDLLAGSALALGAYLVLIPSTDTVQSAL